MNYNEYLTLYNETKNTLKPVYDFNAWAKIKADFRANYENAKTKQEREKIHADFKALEKADDENIIYNETIKIKLEIMQNNLRFLFFMEKMPVIFDVLNKYNGKKYGEKTREKICNELKELTNCSVYFSGYDRLTTCNIHELINGFTNMGGIEIKTTLNNYDNSFIDGNNVIHGGYNFADIHLYDVHGFIEDVDAYADLLQANKKAVIDKYDEYNNAIHEYNKMCFGSFKQVETPKHIYTDLWH